MYIITLISIFIQFWLFVLSMTICYIFITQEIYQENKKKQYIQNNCGNDYGNDYGDFVIIDDY